MTKLPPLSFDLVEELNQMYPNRYPGITDTEREIWFNAGARSVIDILVARKAAMLKTKTPNTDADAEDGDD